VRPAGAFVSLTSMIALQGALTLPPLPSDALRLHSDPSAQLDQERSANQRCVPFWNTHSASRNFITVLPFWQDNSHHSMFYNML
jgi:hypothetical protein